MQTNLGPRFELNLQTADPSEITESATFTVRNSIPAIVVSPDAYLPATQARNLAFGGYKIIVAIDFTNGGKSYALDKLKFVPSDIMAADGFDILLTPWKTQIESSNEMAGLINFLKRLNPATEIRWVIGSRLWDVNNINSVLQAAKRNPASFIRTDPNLISNATTEDHQTDIKRIKRHAGTAVKVSGSVNYEAINQLDRAKRFDVNITQAKQIFKDAIKAQTTKTEEQTAENTT